MTTLFQTSSLFFAYKIAALLLIGLFFIFLLVVLKQTRSMNTVVTEPNLFPSLQLVTLLLLGAVLCLFIAALVIL